MEIKELQEIEIALLLEAIVRRYGYDFRNYSRASIERRVTKAQVKLCCETISDLSKRVLHEPGVFQQLVSDFSITVTEMFRDTPVYRVLQEQVFPSLATYPFIKIWHAGCATGEEVYSLAILLHEAGLLERTTIYGTDFNESALETARQGIYSIKHIKKYSRNYLASGGKSSFSDYYHARYESVIINKKLREHVTFARHNLVNDQVFGEMHLIMCRNVLIYFNRHLQGRVFKLFNESLIHKGFLCIGTKESLQFSPILADFDPFGLAQKIYRKKSANEE